MDTNVLLVLGMAAYGAFLWFLLYHEMHIFSHDLEALHTNQNLTRSLIQRLSDKKNVGWLAVDDYGEYLFFEKPFWSDRNRWVCANEKTNYFELSRGEIRRIFGSKLSVKDNPVLIELA